MKKCYVTRLREFSSYTRNIGEKRASHRRENNQERRAVEQVNSLIYGVRDYIILTLHTSCE